MTGRTNNGSRRLALRAGCAALALGLTAVTGTPPAAAQSRIERELAFDIEPEPLGSALLAFSRAAEIEVVVDPRLTEGRTAGRVRGVMRARDALSQLLAGTGLTVSFRDGVAIIHSREAMEGNDDGAVAQSRPDADEILVVGYRNSLKSSIQAKRDAGQVVDVIDAEDVGEFPEQNVAEAIQRVPGVSMTRSNGEGDTITIRGLDPSLTRVEVDGRSTFLNQDTDQPSRATSLSIFGADQFSRIEVVKSPTARDDEGGVGGIVRLKTPRPLDIGKFRMRIGGQARHNTLGEKIDPSITGTISDVLAEGRLGILLSGSFDDRTRRVDQVRSQNGWGIVPASQIAGVPELAGGVYPLQIDQQFRIGKQPRVNGGLTLQYRPTDTLDLLLLGKLSREQRTENITRFALNFARDRPFTAGVLNPETDTIDSAVVKNAQLTLNNRGLHRDITSLGFTFQPSWRKDRLEMTARVDYSSGEEIGNDRRIRHRSNQNAGWSLEDPEAPSLSLPNLNFDDLGLFAVDQNIMEYRLIKTTEKSAQIDIARAFDGVLSEIALGFKTRETVVTRREGVASGPLGYTFEDTVSDFPIDNFMSGAGGGNFLRVWPYVDADAFVNEHGPSEADGRNSINPALGYRVRENGYSGYVMGSFRGDLGPFDLRGNAGVRGAETRVTAYATSQAIDGNGNNHNVTDVQIGNRYLEWLPSVNLTVGPRGLRNLLFRFAVGRVMTRPAPDQLSPALSLSVDDDTVTRGNPELDPFVAWQYDAGIEYYFGPQGGGLISAGYFHKDIENFVEPVSTTEILDLEPGVGPQPYIVNSFQNGGRGTVDGFELTAQTPFTFLPGFARRFGFATNYTYVESSRRRTDGVTVTIPGNSRHTLNGTFYYEHAGLTLRASYNFRDTYLEQEFGPNGNRVSVDGSGRLDLSMRYTIRKGLRLSVDAANITGEGRHSYADQRDRVINRQIEGRLFTIGLGIVFK